MFKRASGIIMVLVLISTLMLTGCNQNKNPVLVLYFKGGKSGVEGTVEIEMYPDKAPNTVNNIIYLASQGFYDGITVSMVRPDKIVKIGDPRNVQLGGVRYAIEGEFKNNGYTKNDIKFERGIVAMARYEQSYDSAVGDFFIQLDNTTEYDGNYAAFGKVIKGLELIEDISHAKNVGAALGYEPVYSIKIESTYLKLKGETYPEPKTHPRKYYNGIITEG